MRIRFRGQWIAQQETTPRYLHRISRTEQHHDRLMVLHNAMTTGAGIVVCTGIIHQVGTVPEAETTMVRPLSVPYGYRMVP